MGLQFRIGFVVAWSLVVTKYSCVKAYEASIMSLRAAEDDSIITEILARAIQDHIPNKTDLSVQYMHADGKVPKTILDRLCQILDASLQSGKAPLVIDLTKAGVASETVKAFTSAMALPTISASYGQEGDIKAWLSLHPEEEKYLIQICPPNDVFVEVIRAIVSKQNLNNFALLHDENFILSHKALDFTQTLPVRSIMKLIAPGDIRHQLKEMFGLEYRNFFIMGSGGSIGEVLSMAQTLKYLDKAKWFIGISGRNKEVTCDCDGSVISMKPYPSVEYKKKLKNYPDDLAEAFYYDLISKALLAVEALAKEGKWPSADKFVTCEKFSEQKVKRHPDLDFRKALKEVAEPFSYAPWYIESNGNSFMKFNAKLEKITFSSTKQENDVIDVGHWEAGFSGAIHLNSDDALAASPTTPMYRVVTNVVCPILKNYGEDWEDQCIVTINSGQSYSAVKLVYWKMSMSLQPPFVMKNHNPAKGPQYYGLCIDLLNELARRLGFQYSIYEAADGKMGYIDDNGDWSGIVGQLIEKNADIGIASISIMAERERVIDFSIPYYDLVGISILMKKSQTATSLFKFLTVLEADVWLCILAAYFITSLLMWVFDRWSPYSYQNNKEKYKDDEEKRIFNFKECLWFCMTSLTPQGGGEAPKNLSGRLVAATWWLFGFIIMASYTANLAAFLTVSRLDTPIESLDDLSKQYKIGYAPINGTAEMRYFERMASIENKFYEIWKDMSLNDSLSPYERSKLAVWDYPVSDKFTKMWQAMGETGLPHSIEEALIRVRDSRSSSEGFALLGDATDNWYHYYTSCDLQVVGDEFSRKPYAVALQEGSPLRLPINNVLQEMINEGRLIELKTTWWKNVTARAHCEELNEEIDGISIKNIGGVFIVILLGIAGALATLTLEYSWHEYLRSKAARSTVATAWGIANNHTEGGLNRHQRTEEGFSNRYLDPLNLYGDNVMRRTNVQRAFPW